MYSSFLSTTIYCIERNLLPHFHFDIGSEGQTHFGEISSYVGSLPLAFVIGRELLYGRLTTMEKAHLWPFDNGEEHGFSFVIGREGGIIENPSWSLSHLQTVCKSETYQEGIVFDLSAFQKRLVIARLVVWKPLFWLICFVIRILFLTCLLSRRL